MIRDTTLLRAYEKLRSIFLAEFPVWSAIDPKHLPDDMSLVNAAMRLLADAEENLPYAKDGDDLEKEAWKQVSNLRVVLGQHLIALG